jgi:hypothetical protein
MLFRRIILHMVVWLGVFIIFLLATRQYHPTLTIAISATMVLVSISALAVYLNGLFLLPRFARRHARGQYVVLLLATVIILDLIAVLTIQVVYDQLWRPDPMRFGFWFNVMSDGFIIAAHLAIATGIMWVAKLLHRKTLPQPIKG